jgi:hypothetical protein
MSPTPTPLAFCLPDWDPQRGRLDYRRGGTPLLRLDFPAGTEPHFRLLSDGNLQTTPLIQQVFVSVDRAIEVEALFFLSADAVCMKPRRAAGAEAILGQVGRPLLHGVDGLYDITRDMLLSWSGADWRWTATELETARWDPVTGDIVAGGAARGAADAAPADDAVPGLLARMRVQLSPSPWYVTVRPLYYAEHLGYAWHRPGERRPRLDPVTGWCSWEAFQDAVSAGDVREAVGALAERLKAWGLDTLQIDDGFQRSPWPPTADGMFGDTYLVPNGKFPGGHDDIAGAIGARGFTPGIWSGASISNRGFAAREGIGIRDARGEPLEGQWIRFVPSCLPDFLQRHIVPLYRTLRDTGYRYFKCDSLRHLFYDGLLAAVERGLLPVAEARARFRRYLEAIRAGIGPDAFLLSCWGVLSEAVGVCDACRIATDAHPTWGSFLMQVRESGRWFHTQRILFQNDPDHVCVRTDPQWARSLLTCVSMTGGVLMLSDSTEHYAGERLDAIRRTIPAQPVMTAETGPLDVALPAYPAIPIARLGRDALAMDDAMALLSQDVGSPGDHPFSSLWSIHYRGSGRSWCVMGRFAIAPLAQCRVSLDGLALDPEAVYHAFDFWAERYLGTVRGAIDCPALPLGSCQAVCLAPETGRPAFLADNRHVSCGLGFLQGETWDGRDLALDLRGVAGSSFSVWVTVPRGRALESVTGPVEPPPREPGAAVVKMRVAFTHETARCVLRFAAV